MIDIHAPHEAVHTWRDILIHLAIVIVGILIAIGLEQSVELIHRSHQRRELQADLRGEAANNRQIIARDLHLQALEPWFDQAIRAVDAASPQQGRIHITLPFAPCIPGSVGTSTERYFAPSEAVWTTAKESSLVALLPVEQARMYTRLAHNYDLLGVNRDEVYRGCSSIASMQHRLAKLAPGGAAAVWTLTSAQAEQLAQQAGETRTAIKGLCFRLRWSDIYEQGILAGETRADQRMMSIDQERFEDNQDAIQ
jgi:type II secretory pathway pseudopilin PulG